MKRTIQIKVNGIELEAILNNSRTAGAIWEALPITAHTNTWGDEVYFAIPVKLELEKGKELVEIGDLGYWPTGSAFCIFFGPTPMSRGEEIRPASAVAVFGKVVGDATILKKASSGAQIIIERKTE
ncbi:MAG TPA: cyclophilin-like fold protein [Dehalococcoidia bacterium]|nr:cyclophilin-like fold protein [Dehalococcoidia bacterium]